METNLSDDEIFGLFMEALEELREEARIEDPQGPTEYIEETPDVDMSLIEEVISNFLTDCRDGRTLPSSEETQVIIALDELLHRHNS